MKSHKDPRSGSNLRKSASRSYGGILNFTPANEQRCFTFVVLMPLCRAGASDFTSKCGNVVGSFPLIGSALGGALRLILRVRQVEQATVWS